VAWWGHNKFIK